MMALALGAVFAASTATAQPARRTLQELLTSVPVGEHALGDWLGALDVTNCLADEPDGAEALDSMRRWWIRAREDAGHRRAATLLDRATEDFSDEGRALSTAWVDSRAEAKERWLCEDGLPIPRSGLTGEVWREEALGLLAAEAARRLQGVAPGSASAEEAARALRDLVDRLEQRHRAQFPATDASGPSFQRAIASFEAEVLEPVSFGWQGGAGTYAWEPPPGADPALVAKPPDPRGIPFLGTVIAWFVDKVPEPPDMSPPEAFAWDDYEPPIRRPIVPGDGILKDGRVGGEPIVPGVADPFSGGTEIASGGGVILDPKDVIHILRVVEGWDRQTRAIKSEIRATEQLVRELEELVATDGADLDGLARDAERARRRLARLLQDADDHKVRVASWSTGKSWIDAILRKDHVPGMVDRLERGQERAAEGRDDADAAVMAAIERGAADPMQGGFGAGGLGGALRTALGGEVVDRAEAVLAAEAAVEAATAEAPESAGAGAPGRVLRYEGPLPTADPAWSDVVVARVLRAHSELDPVDARILLSMLARAASMERGAVEELVSDWLSGEGRLDLRGGEATLSDLDARDERPEVVFELRFGAEPD